MSFLQRILSFLGASLSGCFIGILLNKLSSRKGEKLTRKLAASLWVIREHTNELQFSGYQGTVYEEKELFKALKSSGFDVEVVIGNLRENELIDAVNEVHPNSRLMEIFFGDDIDFPNRHPRAQEE